MYYGVCGVFQVSLLLARRTPLVYCLLKVVLLFYFNYDTHISTRSHTISLLEGVRHSMTYHVLSVGSRVRVTSYGPFREQWGTVRDVHTIAADLEEPFCFYLIALDSGQRKEPIWFDYSEVELITSSLFALQER